MSATLQTRDKAASRYQVLPMAAALGAEIRGVNLKALDRSTAKVGYEISTSLRDLNNFDSTSL